MFDFYSYWLDTTDINKNIDLGPNPATINIDKETIDNNNFRTTVWTGENLQVVLMNIDIGEDIGLEVHEEGDQFIKIERGVGLIEMGYSPYKVEFRRLVGPGDAIMIPAGAWHNLINKGNNMLKLYVVYAPPEHPMGTIDKRKEDSVQ